MKIRGKSKVIPFPAKRSEKHSGDSNVSKVGPHEFEVSHWRSVRLSLNYNSAEAGYSVKTTVRGTRLQARARLLVLENMVSRHLDPMVCKQLEELKAAAQSEAP